MRRTVEDGAPPGVKRQRPLYEPITHGYRCVGLAIALAAGVKARHLKPLPVQHLEPSPDRNFPVRMLPEKAADDPQPDRLLGVRWIWQYRRRVFRGHNFANQ